MFIMALISTLGMSLSRRKYGSQRVVLAGFASLFVAMNFVPRSNREEARDGVTTVAPHFFDGMGLSCVLLQESHP
jgi:hypothetical protein